ncbi:MAG: hypothetical protein RJA70_3840 [Pseudomonadota bacterium]|jgi:hypothetical protein
MKHLYMGRSLFSWPALWATACLGLTTACSDGPDTVVEQQYESQTSFLQALKTATSEGKARVLVRLNTEFAPEGQLTTSSQVDGQRTRIKGHQDRILGQVVGARVMAKVKRFEFSPWLALETDAATLQKLASLPEVASIHEDAVVFPTVAESVPLIGGDVLTAAGDNGTGQTVAILDTGVDGTHPWLQGRVVSEACYSSDFCPGGASSSTASGSAVPCTGANGCEHGTNVAGVAASGFGVAPGAKIIAVQIFSKTACRPPQVGTCVSASESDILSGLERVYALRSTYSISSVNLSLSDGGKNLTTCGGSALDQVIANLASANIATVIASGNSAVVDGSFAAGIGWPSCVPGAISVGSSMDGGPDSTPTDTISSWSQSAPILSLLAPGELITTSTPGGGTLTTAGTSVAAPHVTGAWAALKSRMGSSTPVSRILTALQGSGRILSDQRGSPFVAVARINVGSVAALSPNLAQGRPVTSSGNGCSFGEEPDKAVNGVGSDKWCAFGANQWINVDLGASYLVKSFTIKHASAGGEDPEYNTKDFDIRVSTNNSTWTKVVTVTGNKAGVTSHTLSSTKLARYIKLTATKPVNSQLEAARIYEFQVFGNPGTNLALRRPTTSTEPCSASETAAGAVNGTINGGFVDKWCSRVAGAKWMKVDLGSSKALNRVVIKHAEVSEFERTGYNTIAYTVEVSTDNTNWRTVASASGNAQNVTAHAFPQTNARYVRLNVVSGGVDGIARIYEFEVY